MPAAGAVESPKSGSKLIGLFKLSIDPSYEKLTRSILVDLLQLVYSKYLLTDPKQRKVILCENPLLPLKLKRLIVSILFDILQVPSIMFMPSPLLAVMVTGRLTALVVDCGHLETTVVPVFDGRPMMHNMQTVPLGGHAVTSRLKNLMKHHGSLIFEAPIGGPASAPGATTVTTTTHSVPEALAESLPLEFWEDLKLRACFVGAFPSPHDVSTDNREPNYPYRERVLPYTIFDSNGTPAVSRISATDRLLVPGWVRERAAEVLFEGDEDERSVVSVILDTLLKCPTDIRDSMIRNVYLIGGTSMLPGFQARLQEQLQLFLEERKMYNRLRRLAPRLKFLRTVYPQNIAQWVGGSLVGALKIGGPEISLETFSQTGELPDWSIPNYKNEPEELE
ncbi:hypothetical protein HK405_012035 [Cladochytrium tenue]|nr:hypothetical protein HK405_012035 [Cladochytrium tenue]